MQTGLASSATRSGAPRNEASAPSWEAIVEHQLPLLLDLADRLCLAGRSRDEAIELTWLQLAQRLPALPDDVTTWLLSTMATNVGLGGRVDTIVELSRRLAASSSTGA